MKHPLCDNVCDNDGLVMTLIAEHDETKIIPSNDGFIRKETSYKTYKKVQCERCLYLKGKSND